MNKKWSNVFNYVLPSVGAMIVTFLYVVVDGIFVGRGVGQEALAAINIAVPFTTLITAIASMITTGGATVTAIRMGRGEKEKANEAFMTSLAFTVFLAIIISVIGVALPSGIAKISGASDILINPTAEYIRYYSLFELFTCLTICMSAFVRNDGNPRLAFWGMIAGAISNVFLDWLFVFPLAMGIKGAAIASGLGQILSFLILLTHFVTKKGDLRISLKNIQLSLLTKIISRGLPELVAQMSQPVTIFCYNYVIMKELGETGIASFSIICYILTLILGVFIGVSSGLQPLLGNSFGENDQDGIKFYFKAGLILNISLSLVIYMALLVKGRSIISIFNSNTELINMAYSAIKIYGFSFLIASVNIIFTTFFFTTKQTNRAIIVASCRSFIFNIIFILLIPEYLGAKYLWIAIILSELVTMLIGLILISRNQKETSQSWVQKQV